MTEPLTSIARRVCTDDELNVLHLRAAGYGRRLGARHLGISEDQWRRRLNSALTKIRTAAATPSTDTQEAEAA